MLLDLGQKDIRLLTNNPDKVRAVEGPNREIVVKERVAMVPLAWKGIGGIRSAEVEQYMKTKVCFLTIYLDISTETETGAENAAYARQIRRNLRYHCLAFDNNILVFKDTTIYGVSSIIAG